ncbi:hypothetical protein ACS0TY_034757 [Phlomoides rotata]
MSLGSYPFFRTSRFDAAGLSLSDKFIIAMARICWRKTEVLLVVEEIILEIVFMLSVIINRYRNMGQFRGLNVENVRRVVKFRFKRSGQTIHTYFHNVLRAVLRLHEVLLAKPSPVTDDSTHPSWKHFKGCLGALDGTLIDVTVPETDKARYRTRKGTISVNVLAAFDRGMHFTYILAGWEGSAADSRVLRDAIARDDGLRVPHGYLNQLSMYMKQVFPNTDLKPEPHINSRITVWKRNYHSLFEILKNTGVGLDSTTKMIEATDEQWDAFMKVDPNARLMRSKSWPLYDDWCEIFSNSRATGEASVSHVRATTPPPPLFSAGMNVDSASNRVGDETQDESESPSGYAQTCESTDTDKMNSGHKRKSPLQPDPMVCVVQNFCDNASNRLGDITQRIGHDQDLSAARKMIYSSISKMSMLTLKEKLRATALIARNAEDIDVFFSLPDLNRVEWVKMLLLGEI